jgi:uncharacterized protein YbaP (TraB family)
VSDPRVATLPPAVEEAFRSSTAVGLESVKPDGRDEDLDAMLRLPPGGDLEQSIGPDLFNAVYRLSASEEGFKEDLRRLTPWAAALMVEKLNRSPDGAPVLDDRLRDAARAAGMTVFGLETVKENRAAYKDLPESQQIDLLRSTLRAAAMPRNVRRAARDSDIRAYLAGDTGFLMRRWNAAFSGGGRARRQLGDQLLDQRSARFADRMVPWLKKGGMFIAIGAAHLPGEGGVIALLRDRGFSVVRVY